MDAEPTMRDRCILLGKVTGRVVAIVAMQTGAQQGFTPLRRLPVHVAATRFHSASIPPFAGIYRDPAMLPRPCFTLHNG